MGNHISSLRIHNNISVSLASNIGTLFYKLLIIVLYWQGICREFQISFYFVMLPFDIHILSHFIFFTFDMFRDVFKQYTYICFLLVVVSSVDGRARATVSVYINRYSEDVWIVRSFVFRRGV